MVDGITTRTFGLRLTGALVAVALALVDSMPAMDDRTWWCVDGSECFATFAECMGPPYGDECVRRPTAWCSYECDSHRTLNTGCSTYCGTEPDMCTAESSECTDQPPPREPQLFPHISFECHAHTGPVFCAAGPPTSMASGCSVAP